MWPGEEAGRVKPEYCKWCFDDLLKEQLQAEQVKFDAKLRTLFETYKSDCHNLENFSDLNTNYKPFWDLDGPGICWILDAGHRNYKANAPEDYYEPRKVLEFGATLVRTKAVRKAIKMQLKEDVANGKLPNLPGQAVVRGETQRRNLNAETLGVCKQHVEQLGEQMGSVIDLHLQQCFDQVKPFVKRAIHGYLRDSYMTHCKHISRTFGEIFLHLAEVSREHEMGANADGRHPRGRALVLDPRFPDFRFKSSMPVADRVKIACVYYMSKRRAFDDAIPGAAEAQDVTDRRDLIMQLVEQFKSTGAVSAHYSKDEKDCILSRGNDQLLFENPDLGGIHWFRRPAECEFRGTTVAVGADGASRSQIAVPESEPITLAEQRRRIFAMFRDFNDRVSQQDCVDEQRKEWPKFLHSVHLRNRDEDGENGKSAKFFKLLDRLPEDLQEILLGANLPRGDDARSKAERDKRPSLHDFLGYETKFVHRNRRLTEAVFVTALKIPEKTVKRRRSER
eukprot:g2314.t1